MSHTMSSSSSDARLRIRDEGRETRVDRIVIMHPDAMAVVLENLQSFSTVHSFEQGQVYSGTSALPNATDLI
jgi:hypothetical protein